MPARRIVSLVPSQTELLSDLGLDSEVVGITKFCIHPQDWKHTKTIVGGTKNVNLDVVDSLRPDLIIANKEENTKEDVEALMKKHQVWMSDVKTVEDAYEMMSKIGELTGTSSSALIAAITKSFFELPKFEIRRTLYLIWKKPWMSVGNDTFINDVMQLAGFENAIRGDRYPKLSGEDIRNLNPEVVLLSSEPYPFKEEHVAELKNLLPASKVMLVDGEMFSWYGSRMNKMAAYFKELRSAF